MPAIEGVVNISFKTEDEDYAIYVMKNVGFRRMFSDAIKESLEERFGELKEFDLKLIPEGQRRN